MEIVILLILCPPACLNIVDLDMKLTTLLLGEILFVFLMGLIFKESNYDVTYKRCSKHI
jgi:hypothetical protein